MDALLEHKFAFLTLAALLCCSAFFSASETALFSLGRPQLELARQRRGRVDRAILLLLENPSRFLVTVLSGNLAVNVLFFCVSATLSAQLAKSQGQGCEALGGLATLVVIIVCGEVMPKAAGVNFPLRISRFAAPPLLAWHWLSTPVRAGVTLLSKAMEPRRGKTPKINAEELRMLLGMSLEGGGLSLFSGEMIEEILDLSELKAKQLMTPRVDLVKCLGSQTVAEVVQAARAAGELFLPVFKSSSEDSPEGVADIKELYLRAAPGDLMARHVKPAAFVPESKRVGDLLELLLAEPSGLAFVVDEYGGFSGMVSAEDILGEIVGETRHSLGERDSEPVARLDGGVRRVDASMPLCDWDDYFEDPLPAPQPEEFQPTTVGGLVTSLLGRLPERGDQARLGRTVFTVESTGRRRVRTVLVSVDKEAAA